MSAERFAARVRPLPLGLTVAGVFRKETGFVKVSPSLA